jgi:hypothetical protein
MRKTDLMDNTPIDPDKCNCDSMPDAGVDTGVTDTYGGGLDKGYQNKKPIANDGMESYVGFA